MDEALAKKLRILADAAKYDASCSSSGAPKRTAGKGELSPDAVPLGTDTEVARFVDQLSPELAADVRAAVDASTAPAEQLYGAVVGLGCDVPPGVAVTRTSTGFDITGLKVADPLQECFAAVTSVAVVAISG